MRSCRKCLLIAPVLLGIAGYFFLYKVLKVDQFRLESFDVQFPRDFNSNNALHLNSELEKTERLFRDIVTGGESLVEYGGFIYTGTKDWTIKKINLKTKQVTTLVKLYDDNARCTGQYNEHHCGRALGLRVDSIGRLHFVDAYNGIAMVDLNAKVPKVVTVFKPNTNVTFLDDLVLKETVVKSAEGNKTTPKITYYFSDSSQRWRLNELKYLALERETTGALSTYDPETGVVTRLLEGLAFPNGVEISDDGHKILVAEFNKMKVHRYYISGPKAGTSDILIDNLPGEPDNIRRSAAKKETYWIGFFSARNASSVTFNDRISPYPLLRLPLISFVKSLDWAAEQLKIFGVDPQPYSDFLTNLFFFVYSKICPHGLVIEVDANGNIINSLHSDNGIHLGYSEVREIAPVNGKRQLLFGSFINSHVGRVLF